MLVLLPSSGRQKLLVKRTLLLFPPSRRGPANLRMLLAEMRLPTTLRATQGALKDGARVICRALGLNVIVSGLRSVRHLALGKGYDEPIKVAIRKSRTTALLRALIHVVPLGVALWEIILNWNTYYVGESIRSLAYYQFGAKIHEMTAQASIAAILVS